LTLAAYKATAGFPDGERYGLVSQIRKCSASIAANLAEGCGRQGDGEFHRFLQIASGSASGLEYHFLLAHDLKLLAEPRYEELNRCVTEIKRMLTSLSIKVASDRKK